MTSQSRSSAMRPPLSLGVVVLGAVGYVVGLLLVIVVTVIVAVLLGLLGLGSLVATVVFAGLLAAAVLSFAFFPVVVFSGARRRRPGDRRPLLPRGATCGPEEHASSRPSEGPFLALEGLRGISIPSYSL